MKSPDVIQLLKKKQKEIEKKSKAAMSLTTHTTLINKHTVTNQTDTNQTISNQSTSKITQNRIVSEVECTSKHLIEDRMYADQNQQTHNTKSENGPNHKSLGIPLQDLNNLDFLDTNLNFDMSSDDDFYRSYVHEDAMKTSYLAVRAPSILPYMMN